MNLRITAFQYHIYLVYSVRLSKYIPCSSSGQTYNDNYSKLNKAVWYVCVARCIGISPDPGCGITDNSLYIRPTTIS
jgi:hypothetical protein